MALMKGDFMKEITLIMRFVVIGLMYIILLNFIRVMLKDLRATMRGDASIDYALEVIDAPDLSGVAIGAMFPVRDETSIGRNENNQIVIKDPFISGKHAVVYMEQDKLFIKDLKSTNGTKLNNDLISEIIELRDGDVLEIGRIILKVIG